MTPEAMQQVRWQQEIDERNRPLTDDDLDAIFPPTGYKILKPPDNYVPIRTPARKLLATPTPGGGVYLQNEFSGLCLDTRGKLKAPQSVADQGTCVSAQNAMYAYDTASGHLVGRFVCVCGCVCVCVCVCVCDFCLRVRGKVVGIAV